MSRVPGTGTSNLAKFIKGLLKVPSENKSLKFTVEYINVWEFHENFVEFVVPRWIPEIYSGKCNPPQNWHTWLHAFYLFIDPLWISHFHLNYQHLRKFHWCTLINWNSCETINNHLKYQLYSLFKWKLLKFSSIPHSCKQFRRW